MRLSLRSRCRLTACTIDTAPNYKADRYTTFSDITRDNDMESFVAVTSQHGPHCRFG